ncbi:sensor histidine kinase [Streptomyces sp. NPDC097619]|uniref:sensor histidine kinase n=1 Tax=Streptomyces sp. NPDC097619 TaxID=3157228 RepID=UPI003324ADCD
MNSEPDSERGRGLPEAVRLWPRRLATDLFTLRRDPFPPLRKPRRLNRLPQVLGALVAYMFGGLTTTNLTNHYDITAGTALPVGIVTGVSVFLAMFRPIAAWWLALITGIVAALSIHGSVGPGQNWMWPPSSMFAFAAVLFLAALRVTPRVTLELTGVALLVTFVIETIWRPEHSSLTGFQVAVLFGFSSLLGYALRGVRVARGRLHDQEALTEEERSRRALLEERSRIARELHDVVAHHMSVISIQAQVAPYLVTDPPEELKENLAGIRQNALEALTELRRVLGVLRSESAEDQADQHHPQPTLADLGSLVDNVRAAGLSVAVETAGIRRPLTPGVELSAYRIVQEALSNCLRHAPGSQVEVGIAYGPRDLYLCVANTAPTGPVPASPGAGHGLLGMRERAGMLGGELAAGPRPNGGYEVSAVLPTGSVATPTEPKKET